ncbi:hypothetical protein PFNF135_05172 [Plasmodium falciparum NF135/5.C10]|uniref:Uncharacterized protein n=1 Tax=Plasmodium falciparum NF135/5.C10 TaxID=1036726 RepID=W4I9W0_PLAFA|nr:hypothetical protein PFNF135_05172 [Plasmodium falciparum NF135/5.C10]
MYYPLGVANSCSIIVDKKPFSTSVFKEMFHENSRISLQHKPHDFLLIKRSELN